MEFVNIAPLSLQSSDDRYEAFDKKELEDAGVNADYISKEEEECTCSNKKNKLRLMKVLMLMLIVWFFWILMSIGYSRLDEDKLVNLSLNGVLENLYDYQFEIFY